MSKLKLNQPQTKIKASKHLIASIIALTMVIAGLLGGFFYAPKPAVAATGYGLYQIPVGEDYVEDRILYLVNQERARVGRAPLRMQYQLRYASDIRVLEESKTNFAIDHLRPNGTSYSTVYHQVGYYGYTAWGENLAWGYLPMPNLYQSYLNYLALRIFTQWRDSPGHYANMINGNYNQTGVGVHFIVANGHFYYFADQEFARRAW